MWRASVTFSLFAAVTALQLRFQEECRVQMHNNDDMDYTMALSIGGEVVHVIPDTGSFAMVLFSDKCESCGEQSDLLHPKKMKNLVTGDHRAMQNYGSGATFSVDAYSSATVACNAGTLNMNQTRSIQVAKQMFWMTVKANMPIAAKSSFQGILGLGPPRSEARVAQMEAAAAKEEVDQLAAAGQDVSQYETVVKGLQGVAALAKKTKTWLVNEGVHTLSVCLPSAPGSPGVLIYNDRKPIEKPALFASIGADMNGTYWQVPFSDISVGDEQDDDRIHTTGSTTAILDTGTSLIGAPGWFVESIASFISARIETLGCDDLSKWPSWSFKLDGVSLTLPPSSYIGKVMNLESLEQVPTVKISMPHLTKSLGCTAMLFSTTDEAGDAEQLTRLLRQDPDDSPSWIFGLPFFRAYYTAFQLSKDFEDARRVYVAEADEACDIKDSHAADAAQALRVSEKFVAPMAIDPRKLRLPKRRGLSATLKRKQLAVVSDLDA